MTRQQLKLVSGILLYPAILLLMLRSLLERKGYPETADTVAWICLGFTLALLITRLIYWLAPKLGSKPTREDIEARNFSTSDADRL